jgi:aspartyl-tRNA(Asn)/glutamyl-tRNA(Gln) amidotransferase subunit B
VRRGMPELPWVKRERFMAEYGLSEYDAGVLSVSRAAADYFEQVAAGVADKKLAANWVMGDFAGALNKAGLDITSSPLSADALLGLLRRIEDNTISGKIAKEVFEAMWAGEGDADAIIEARGLTQITDTSSVEAVIRDVMAASPGQLEQYRGGKDKLFGYFVGQVMKATGGKANPALVNELLKKLLAG